MQILLVETEFSHADRRTDAKTLIDTFLNFAKAPKKCYG